MITRDEVVWAYKVIFNRDPESEDCIQEKMRSCANLEALRDTLLASDEYVRSTGGTPGKSNIVIKPIGNMRIYVDMTDKVVGMAIIQDRYEPAELQFVRNTVKRGWSVLDIGANYGVYTVTMSPIVGPEGHVTAFEPLSHIRQLLVKTVRENKFSNVRIHSEAAGMAAAKVKLIYAPNTINHGGAYLGPLSAEVPPNHRGDIVTMIPIGLLNLPRPIRFIKMDIEGAEGWAVRGMENILMEDRPIVLCELHDPQLRKVSGISAPEFIRQVTGMGYSCSAFVPGGLMPISGPELNGRVANAVFSPK